MTGSSLETRAARVQGRFCRHCGESFTPVREHQRFCKPSCRWNHCKAKGNRGSQSEPQLDGDVGDLFATPFE